MIDFIKSLKSNKTFRQRVVILAVLVVVVFGGLGVGREAVAAAADNEGTKIAEPPWLVGKLLDFIAALISTFIELVASAIGKLFLVITDILIGVIQYNNFIYEPVVLQGWATLRDLSNMFFVLILLVIAIATILQIETYHYKRLLLKLILMAILVNFSKLICGIIIDFSQVITLYFANSIREILAAGILNMMGITDIHKIVAGGGGGLSILDIFASLFLALIMLIIATFVVLAFVLVFAFRIVALWLLVVLSPLAYLLAAFPQGERYSRQWWDSFTKYVIIGPVLIFFLWLAISTSKTTLRLGQYFERPVSQIGQSAQPNQTQMGVAEAGKSVNILQFIITICFLVGGLIAAQKSSTYGAGFAGAVAGRMKGVGMGAIRGAGAVAKSPLGYAGRKWSEFIATRKSPAWSILNPAAMVRGYKLRQTELHQRAAKSAELGAQEFWDRALTRGRVRAPRRQAFEVAEESRYAKDYAFMPAEVMADQAYNLSKGRETPEVRRRKRALITAAAEKGYLDNLMAHQGLARKYGTLSTNPESGNEEFYSFKKLNKFLGSYIGDHDDGLRLIFGLEEMASRVKHPEYAGHARYDPELKKYRMANAEDTSVTIDGKPVEANEAQKYAIAEFNKWAGRTKMAAHIHGVAALEKTPEGMVAGRSDDIFYKEVIRSMIGGQPEGPMREHTTDRLVRMVMGQTASEVKFDAQGRLALNKSQLDTLARFQRHNNKAISSFWEKIGGKRYTPDAQFVYRGNPILLPNSNQQLFSGGPFSKQDIDGWIANNDVGAAMAAFPEEVTSEPQPELKPHTVLGAKTATAKPRKQVGLGVNFDESELKELNLGGKANIGFNLAGKLKDKAIPKLQALYKKYLTDNMGKTEAEAEREVDSLGKSLEQAETIRLTNIGNSQWQKNKFAIARHEQVHPAVAGLADQDIDEILSTVSETERKDLIAQYRKRYGGMQAGVEGRALEREIVTDMIAGQGRSQEDQAKHPASLKMNEKTAAALNQKTPKSTESIIKESRDNIADQREELEKAGGDTEAVITALMAISGSLEDIKQVLETTPGKNEKLNENINQALASVGDGLAARRVIDSDKLSNLLFQIHKDLKEVGGIKKGKKAAGEAAAEMEKE